MVTFAEISNKVYSFYSRVEAVEAVEADRPGLELLWLRIGALVESIHQSLMLGKVSESNVSDIDFGGLLYVIEEACQMTIAVESQETDTIGGDTVIQQDHFIALHQKFGNCVASLDASLRNVNLLHESQMVLTAWLKRSIATTSRAMEVRQDGKTNFVIDRRSYIDRIHALAQAISALSAGLPQDEGTVLRKYAESFVTESGKIPQEATEDDVYSLKNLQDKFTGLIEAIPHAEAVDNLPPQQAVPVTLAEVSKLAQGRKRSLCQASDISTDSIGMKISLRLSDKEGWVEDFREALQAIKLFRENSSSSPQETPIFDPGSEWHFMADRFSTRSVGMDLSVEVIGETKEFVRFWQLPGRDPDFVERHQVYKQMADGFQQNTPNVIGQVIVGASGVGKTALAVAFARQHQSQSPRISTTPTEKLSLDAILLLDASNMAEQTTTLAKSMEIDTSVHTGKGLCARILTALCPLGTQVLLIFDDAEQESELADWLDALVAYRSNVKATSSPTHFHLLVTSINLNWAQWQSLQLGPFREHEAVSFIQKTLPLQTSEEVRRLALMTRGVPSVLARAVDYIRSGLETIPTYLDARQAKIVEEQRLLDRYHNLVQVSTLALYVFSTIVLREEDEEKVHDEFDAQLSQITKFYGGDFKKVVGSILDRVIDELDDGDYLGRLESLGSFKNISNNPVHFATLFAGRFTQEFKSRIGPQLEDFAAEPFNFTLEVITALVNITSKTRIDELRSIHSSNPADVDALDAIIFGKSPKNKNVSGLLDPHGFHSVPRADGSSSGPEERKSELVSRPCIG